MDLHQKLLVFSVDEQRCGIGLTATERVLAALEITPLPKAPGIVLGIFNLQGRIIPVFDIRRRFGWREREISPDQQFIIARTSTRTVALVVDSTHGVIDPPVTDRVNSEAILRDLPHVRGVTRTPDGLVLVHDLETFLSFDEALVLDAALRTSREGVGAP